MRLFRATFPLSLALACAPSAGDPADTDPAPDTDPGPIDTDPVGPTPLRSVVLRLPEGTAPVITLDLDRPQVADLFGEAAADIVLLELGTLDLVRASLDAIKAACGTDWKRNTANPVYDCSLTALGRSFAGPDGTWRTSAEFSLIGILTTTPANADVAGTSVATLAGLANFLNLGGGFSQILADTFQIARTEEFLDTEPLAQAIVDHVIATHPAAGPGGTIVITLADALDDLRPLGPRFGPTAAHPGVVDPDSPTFGAVLGPDFRMVASLRSNLRVLEGLDLDRGKDWVAVRLDTTGPTFEDEVEFFFDDPDAFRIEGLTPNPTLDLRFTVQEDDIFVPACVDGGGQTRCSANAPATPIGTNTIWRRERFTTEYVIASAGVTKYGGLRNRVCYLGCLVSVDIGQNADPAGFVRFGALAALLAPGPQYAWELINELAQVRLHANPFATLAEGAADVAYPLRDIPVGITGEQAAEAVRPVLQAQRDLVSDFLLGDYRKNSGTADLLWRRIEDGRPALLFAVPSDRPEGDTVRYTRAGVWADRALTEALHVEGTGADAGRLVWAPPPGASTAFVQDDRGEVYRLALFLTDPANPRAPLSIDVFEAAP